MITDTNAAANAHTSSDTLSTAVLKLAEKQNLERLDVQVAVGFAAVEQYFKSNRFENLSPVLQYLGITMRGVCSPLNTSTGRSAFYATLFC